MNFKFISILLIQFLIIVSAPLYAQVPVNPATIDVNNLSDAQIQKIMQEIQSRGLTQDQAIAMAKAQGASQAQIDQLMVRMGQLSGSQTNSSSSSSSTTAINQTPQSVTYSTPKAIVNLSPRAKKIFGVQLFNSTNLTFEPAVNIPIPQSYILGIGDQLSITVWGASQTYYQLLIDKSGSITIPDVGPVFLSGLTFEKGQSLIKSRLMSIYSGMSGAYPNTWAEVSLGAVRSIKVSVIGDINAPGTYTIPSTATAFNALYLSGGPNENGSFRDIKLIRDGVTIKTIDVYDFLINANPAANVQLREQDILFVPSYKSHVEVAGEFKREGIYEMQSNESLSDLIRFAGGFGDKAYRHILTVIRNNDREREINSVEEANFSNFTMQNGDSIKADTIISRFTNRVAIQGAVFHPGNFELSLGMKLSDLIRQADGLREDAFLNRGLIHRISKVDNSPENINFDLNQVMKGINDIVLRREDKVVINSIFTMREARTLTIAGEVINPGEFDYQDNITLGDLIFKAGGFREEANLSVIEVSRRLNYDEAAKVTDKMNTVFQFTIPRDLKLTPEDAAFQLKPLDRVDIRRAPGYRDQGTFTITGEVTYTGAYAITDKNERVSHAVERAGGLIPGAFIKGATLTRTVKLSAAEMEKKKLLMKKDTTLDDSLLVEAKTYPVGIELDKILEHPGSPIDLLLQPGDVINIPRELQTVKVSGSIMNPLALTYKKGARFRKYIDMAGGYDGNAKKSRTYVLYPNGITASVGGGFICRKNPRITPGSEIIVPRKPDRKGEDTTMKWISIASAMSSLAIAFATLVKL